MNVKTTMQVSPAIPRGHGFAMTDRDPPTVEYAARVVYEALTACPLPEHASAALGQRSDAGSVAGPKWADLTDEQRAWWTDMLWGACVPFDRFDDPVEPDATVYVVPAHPDLFTQAPS